MCMCMHIDMGIDKCLDVPARSPCIDMCIDMCQVCPLEVVLTCVSPDARSRTAVSRARCYLRRIDLHRTFHWTLHQIFDRAHVLAYARVQPLACTRVLRYQGRRIYPPGVLYCFVDVPCAPAVCPRAHAASAADLLPAFAARTAVPPAESHRRHLHQTESFRRPHQAYTLRKQRVRCWNVCLLSRGPPREPRPAV